ncbi:hypothetical protein I553_7841 [Mycobacterium xenopi 4042]|uniref:Uncharacterized protein n=1 Tax=Mycobacterium xenopi 4042 TaxID=1299334 RepID=X8ARK5_MYCXE|nr:hypothetical protein I553_7841 [Mycobacterium xenopi 4042]
MVSARTDTKPRARPALWTNSQLWTTTALATCRGVSRGLRLAYGRHDVASAKNISSK